MKTVSAVTLREAIDLANEALHNTIMADQQGGTITALSYISFDVDWSDNTVTITAYNRGFNGDPGEAREALGNVRLDDGRIIPVIYIRRDRGIVTGEEALDHMFDLFLEDPNDHHHR